jgi:hypothetical protein
MKNIIYISFAFIMLSCHYNSLRIGTYSFNNSDIGFTLNSDSTFTYTYMTHLLLKYKYSEGHWSIGGKKIVLNSSLKNKLLQLSINDTSISKKISDDSILININIANMLSEDKKYYQILMFNNNSLVAKKESSVVDFIIPNINLRNVNFKISCDNRIPSRMFDTLSTEMINLTGKIATNKISVNIHYQPELFNYIFFENTKLSFSKNKINYNNIWYHLNNKK